MPSVSSRRAARLVAQRGCHGRPSSAHVHIQRLERHAGIAARYVSGHLVGEGGSHAWVEALVPDPDHPGDWALEAWDPTHDRPAGDGYVMVATGRDYADVAPLSGSYSADRAAGELSVRKRLIAQHD